MVVTVETATGLVLTLKVVLLLPAGTVTLGGTLAAALLLESVTSAPAVGAGHVEVTDRVEPHLPAMCRTPSSATGS